MVTRSLNIWQIDFVSAFLNSENSFEIYMKQPKDFEKRRDEYIYILLKTLYKAM